MGMSLQDEEEPDDAGAADDGTHAGRGSIGRTVK
jgi:hypothetical protein